MAASAHSPSSQPTASQADDLQRAVLLIADAIGDVIERWGFRKVLGRMWTVLYLAGEPLSAAELAERLALSSGSVSMALGELQEWAVVKRALRPGERREYFIAETDFWKMISKVVSERERFLVTSVRERLAEASALLKTIPHREAREALGRTKILLSIAQTAETVIESFLASRRADFSGFGALIQLPRSPGRDKKTS